MPEKNRCTGKGIENILEGQKLMSLYKPKWNKYFPFYDDTINSVVQSEDKIILRISENSCIPFRINLADLSSKSGDKNINFIYCFKMGADR